MKCSKCGIENQESRKFCRECGTKRSIICPSSVLILICILSLSLILSGCSSNEEEQKSAITESPGQKPTVKIVYVDWASEIASSNVVKAVIVDELNMNCELLSVSLIAMWEAIAVGDQDAMVSAWLPSLQAHFLDKFKSQVDHLGPNLKGTKIGLVVPQYVSIDSIDELQEHQENFDNKIIGIDPHAGIMEKAAAALKEYKLDKYQLVSGSGPTMTRTLESAIAEGNWIVVTGWTPHWKFARWDLKYLKDTKNVFGKNEYIGTIVRKGLKNDMPEVYRFLDNFHWSPDDMAQVMLWAQDQDTTYLEAARRWIKNNQDIVKVWLK